ncbi:hypothetical protein V1264_001741 [Littorina saxatilis]|uniref:C-type lectin domain-containing protein n=1 Tax=Littorina saxatilis TaxID=31220 RepID=A0AAN9C7U5_9CAEN
MLDSPAKHHTMEVLCQVIAMTMLLHSTRAVVTIPDSVSHKATNLVFYQSSGTWQQADQVCRANGGYLVLVDDQEMADKLAVLREVVGGLR